MSFADTWQKAGEAPDDFEPPPDQYKVKVVDGNAFTSRAGDDYCKLVLEILSSKSGEFVGQRFEHFMGFAHPVGARINREALLAYGLKDPENIGSVDDLDDRIAGLKGTEADVGVSYKDGYIQIKVHGSRTGRSDIPTTANGDVVGPEPAAQTSFSAAAGAKNDDDPIPF